MQKISTCGLLTHIRGDHQWKVYLAVHRGILQTERFVIRVRIPESSVKPVILKYRNIPSIFMRRDGFTNGATYEEIIEMSVKSKNTQYDILVSDVAYDSAKLSMLRAFYAEHNDGKELKEKALQSMGFYNEESYLLNGAVLFLDDYSGKKTEIQCSVFSGFNKGSERIVTINRFCGNITSTIQYMMDFVNQRMNHSMNGSGLVSPPGIRDRNFPRNAFLPCCRRS